MNANSETVYLSRPAVMRKIDGVLSNYTVEEVGIVADHHTGGLQVAFYGDRKRIPITVRFIPQTTDRETADELRASLLRSVGYHLNR